MKLLGFILIYPLIWILSILPFRVLYFLSDLFFLVIYYVLGYRKKVVYNNLKLAFPEKNKEELLKLTKKNIHHFSDFIFETIKTFTISEKEIKKRYTYRNLDVLKQYENNTGIILTGCHYANWEWIIYLAKLTDLLPVGIYKKINNPYFENFIKSSRSRFGAILRRTTETKSSIEDDIKNNVYGLYFLLSDQSPQLHKTKYWTNYFNINVPVIVGAEELAKKHNFPVINFNVYRIKRGFYEIEFEVITNKPRKFNNYEITEKYLSIIEQHISKQPEFYLWTHKRFKHKDKKPTFTA